MTQCAPQAAEGKAPGGALSDVHPADLLAVPLKALLRRSGIDPGTVDDVLVIAGCVSQVGEQSYNITRNAVLAAGSPRRVPGTTVDRQCGSSQQAAHFAAQAVLAGQADIVIACGVESMSRVPLGIERRGRRPATARGSARGTPRAREPGRLGRADRREVGVLARGARRVRGPVAPARGRGRGRVGRVRDRGRARAGRGRARRRDRAPRHDGRVARRASTPRSAATGSPSGSPSSTGGSRPATRRRSPTARPPPLIMSAEAAEQLGLEPRARFRAFSVVGSDPLYMLTGPYPRDPAGARARRTEHADIDAYEVNEAFASVPLAWAPRDRGGCREAQPARRRDRPGARARLVGHAPAHHPRQPARGHRRAVRPADDVRGRRWPTRRSSSGSDPVLNPAAAGRPRFPLTIRRQCRILDTIVRSGHRAALFDAKALPVAYVIGVDVGGTFTDAVLADEAGNVLGAKSPSTPPDYSMGVIDVLALLAEQMDMPTEQLLAQTHHIAHGTTSSLNALVMGNVPPVGFITTRGHHSDSHLHHERGGPLPGPLERKNCRTCWSRTSLMD